MTTKLLTGTSICLRSLARGATDGGAGRKATAKRCRLFGAHTGCRATSGTSPAGSSSAGSLLEPLEIEHFNLHHQLLKDPPCLSPQVQAGQERIVEKGPLSLSVSSLHSGSPIIAKVCNPNTWSLHNSFVPQCNGLEMLSNGGLSETARAHELARRLVPQAGLWRGPARH